MLASRVRDKRGLAFSTAASAARALSSRSTKSSSAQNWQARRR